MPRERADAARNRRAILAATERLLAANPPRDISMEQVATEAGVAKGTVFHRFGSRAGLMLALMVERAHALEDAVRTGPPPLGEGAPDRDRLLAFVDAIVDVVSRNKSLLAELSRSGVTLPSSDEYHANQPNPHAVYAFWHGHISALLLAGNPEVDADTFAHVLLGSLHSDPILARLTAEGPDRLKAALRSMITAQLDAPRTA
ncbi:TetR/AcrR family transcriptional regulator [Actinomadura logoneensis]|uniref:TetR/AcrR family transcriptional regulator n=1 Tax=Actinomadura logoneensis TaxID=2293572 RepID=A0A372JAC6_9ACTN|nr:TetR/AcrR family transcriptional regulator [Actinomadura logoneensis]RFU36764.1 TetR/AcrR family transcriptional regulator [Actinomadura logoneensis]